MKIFLGFIFFLFTSPCSASWMNTFTNQSDSSYTTPITLTYYQCTGPGLPTPDLCPLKSIVTLKTGESVKISVNFNVVVTSAVSGNIQTNFTPFLSCVAGEHSGVIKFVAYPDQGLIACHFSLEAEKVKFSASK